MTNRQYDDVQMSITYDCGWRAGLQEGRDEERKRIIKWLKRVDSARNDGNHLGWAAFCLEEGAHCDD